MFDVLLIVLCIVQDPLSCMYPYRGRSDRGPQTRSSALAMAPPVLPPITADDLGLHLIAALKQPDVVAAFMGAFTAHTLKLQQEIQAAHTAIKERDAVIDNLKKGLEAAVKRIDKLEDGLDQQEQQGRKPSMRVFGIPEVEHETAGQLKATVLDVVQAKLQLHDIEADDLEVVHRCGPMPAAQQPDQEPPKPRSVIVKFHHRDKRSLIFKKGVLGRLKNSGLIIAEDLSKRRAEIAYHCRQKVRDEKIAQTWTTNGKILIKDNAGSIRVIATLAQAKNL